MEPVQAVCLGHSSGLVETDSRDRPHMGAWTVYRINIKQQTREILSNFKEKILRTRYEDMPQSLRTSMLFCGWLIDWVQGYASKSAHPVFASKSAHFENRYFPETNRPNSANSSLPMGIVIILRMKQNWTRNLRWFPTKNGKKCKQRLLNQSINHWIIWERADFEAYFCTRKNWEKIGMNYYSYTYNQSFFWMQIPCVPENFLHSFSTLLWKLQSFVTL